MLTFFYPVLRMLENGSVIRKSIALGLKVTGIFALLAGVLVGVQILKFSLKLESATATIGGFLLSVCALAAVVCICQICFYRASSVQGLGDSPFTVIPIFSILLRAIGEAYATFGLAIGLGGCFFVWLAEINPLQMLGALSFLAPSYAANGSFIGGLGFLVYSMLFSLVALIIFYFLAEAVLVLADVARNLNVLAYPAGAAKTSAGYTCGRCGGVVSGDAEFCDTCGVKVRGQAAR